MAAPKFRFELRSADGQRRRLPRKIIASTTWNETRYGGFADFTMDLHAEFNQMTEIVDTDVLSIIRNGTECYRGEVTNRRRSKADPSKLTLTGYGFFVRWGNRVAQKRYIQYGGVDIAQVFRDIAKDWIQSDYPDLIVRADDIGQTLDSYDAFTKRVKDAYDDLINLSGNQAVWGGGIANDPEDLNFGANTLFMRPISKVINWAFPATSLKIGDGQVDADSEQVRNVLHLIGGTPKYPNMLYNGGFERPVFAGEQALNVLNTPGFEGRSNWDLYSGASYKSGGKSEGSTYAGGDMVLIDNAGEGVRQTVNPSTKITVGVDYQFACHAKLLNSNVATGTMTLEWLGGGGAVLETHTVAVTPASAIWDYFYGTSRAPAGTTGYMLQVQNDAGNSLLLDNMELYDASSILQDKWTTRLFGESVVNIQNGAYPDAHEGGYSYFLDVTCMDANSHDLHLRLSDDCRFDVVGNQTMRFGVWIKNPPGSTNIMKLRLVMNGFHGDGSQAGFTHTEDFDMGAVVNDWTFVSTTYKFSADSVKGEAFLCMRRSGQYLFDACCCRDIASTPTGDLTNFYIPDGPLQYTFRADEVFDPIADPDLYHSIAVYGVRDDVDTQDALTTYDDALAYAQASMRKNALPPRSVTIQLVDDGRLFQIGDLVNLTGVDALVLSNNRPLPIVNLEHNVTEQYIVKLGIDNEPLDMGDQVLAAIQKKLARGGVDGPGSGFSSQSSAGSASSGSGVSYWGTGPRTVDDPTLHDDYAPAAGPHVLSSERTAWDGTTSEVDDARGAYTTLGDRLDAIAPIGPLELADITDVDTSTATTGMVLYRKSDGSYGFEAPTGGGASTLAALTDVDTTGQADGYVLSYDLADANYKFVPQSGGGGSSAGLPIAIGSVPAASTFTKVHGTDFTVVTNADGSIRMEVPSTAAVGAMLLPVPSTPYVFTVGVLANSYLTQLNLFGPCIQDSTSGKYVIFNVGWDSNSPQYWVIHNNGSANNVDLKLANAVHPYTQYIFMRISDDGTTRRFLISSDGFTFMQVAAEATGSYITPDHIGFGFTTYGGAAAFTGSIFYWDVH